MTGETSAALHGRQHRERFTPLRAQTVTVHRPVDPVAYDCVRLVVVRDGSAILFSEFGEKSVAFGDVVLLGANILCGGEPESKVTTTTIYADTDYVLDQVRWRHAQLLNDRLDARDFAERAYAEAVQVLRVGEAKAGELIPWLDELVALGIDGRFTENFYRMQALWFAIADVVAPFIRVSPVQISSSRRAHTRPVLPREREFSPLREEARRVAELLHERPEGPWRLDGLASRVHLSTSQLSRVFIEAYGKTPLAYLTMLRAERLARILRDTDLPIEAAMRQVGWHSRGHAAKLFRQHVGVTPSRYRSLAPGVR